MENRYKAKDFGRLILHWLVTVLGSGAAFYIAYADQWETGESWGIFYAPIYAVNKSLFFTGAAIIAVGYVFVWKLWLKKDLMRCLEAHWEWVALYAVVALWNLVLVFVLGLVAMMLHTPNFFASLEDSAEYMPLIAVAYMILFPIVESLITGLKRKS